MTTKFYSTKRNANVDIPNNKVCGYKIKNYTSKKGWQSGMCSGLDNGVVNQKFSRFSTDCDAEDVGKCGGNTNWLNHKKGEDFTKVLNLRSGGQAFSINRPAYRAGALYQQERQADSIQDFTIQMNQRNGLGNYDITRNNFTAPNIKARVVQSFAKLQADDATAFSNEVELGTKTLEKFFSVNIPDPLDTRWLDEKARLTVVFASQGLDADQIAQELEINKPLGREQRTVKGSTNIGTSSLTFSKKIAEIVQEVQDGRAENRAGAGAIAQQLILVLADTANLSNINQQGVQQLMQVIGRLNIPKQWDDFFPGGTRQIVDTSWMTAHAGEFNLFILSNVAANPLVLNYRHPLFNLSPNARADRKIMQLDTLANGARRLGGARLFVDLLRRAVITAGVAKALIDAGATFAVNNLSRQIITNSTRYVGNIPNPAKNEDYSTF